MLWQHRAETETPGLQDDANKTTKKAASGVAAAAAATTAAAAVPPAKKARKAAALGSQKLHLGAPAGSQPRVLHIKKARQLPRPTLPQHSALVLVKASPF